MEGEEDVKEQKSMLGGVNTQCWFGVKKHTVGIMQASGQTQNDYQKKGEKVLKDVSSLERFPFSHLPRKILPTFQTERASLPTNRSQTTCTRFTATSRSHAVHICRSVFCKQRGTSTFQLSLQALLPALVEKLQMKECKINCK